MTNNDRAWLCGTCFAASLGFLLADFLIMALIAFIVASWIFDNIFN
jgi:hypothetical protein